MKDILAALLKTLKPEKEEKSKLSDNKGDG